MRVLLTTPYGTSSVTGVGRFVRGLARRIVDEGGVAVVAEPDEDADPQGLRNLLLALRSVRAVFRNRRSVDVVHCQALHLQSLLAGLVARILGKGVVLTVHGPSARQPGIRWYGSAAVERACLGVPHRLVVVADFLKPALRPRAIVIPNGVPLAEIQSHRGTRAQVRKELDVDGGTVLMYVGRVTADKGFWTLVESVEALRSEGRAQLRLVCIGPISEDVRDGLARRPPAPWLRLLGSRPDPWRFLGASDVFVLPSLREGLPLSLLEAMAFGLPVVATRVGGVPLVVQDGLTGRLVPPGDSRALADAIRWVTNHPEDSRALGMAGLKLVESNFSEDRMWEDYARAYRESVDAS